MTLKEIYEAACEKNLENLQVLVLRPGEADYYGNKSLPKVVPGQLIYRDKDFWPGIDEDFLTII